MYIVVLRSLGLDTYGNPEVYLLQIALILGIPQLGMNGIYICYSL